MSSSYLTASLRPNDSKGSRLVIGAGFCVSAGFLSTMGATVLAGDGRWRADSGTVVISRTTLEQLFPGDSPASVIGRIVPARGNVMVRIAAVIEDMALSDITSPPPPLIIRPLAERPRGLTATGFVRTNGSPTRAVAVVRRAFDSVAPDVPVFAVRTARAAVDQQFADRLAMASAASALGTLGVVLAAIGLYGVLANLVAARRREIGIRMALGAAPRRILVDVLRNGLLPVSGGIVVGVVGAVVAGRLLKAQLFGLQPLDLTTYVGAIAALTAVTIATCLLPAHRATRVSPVTVLRSE